MQLANAVHSLHDEPEFVGHARQVAPVVPAVVVEYLPVPQLVHAIEPVILLYFPAVQAVHKPPSGPV